MLGPVGARSTSTWTPVRGDAPSPSLPTLAIQVLSSFPPLLQLLPSHRGRADKERNRQRPPAHQAAQRAAEQTSVIPTSQSFPVISCAAPVSAASTPSPTSAVFLPASASVAPNSTPAYASVASSPLPAASSSSTVTVVSALSSAPVMSTLFATASVTSIPSSSTVSRHQACCTSWEEVENLHSEFNYSHEGKYCDERGVRNNSNSDASDIASRCPECPECSMERHTALKKRENSHPWEDIIPEI